MNASNITPTELLKNLKQKKILGVLDVRSEGEYFEGNFQSLINAPILRDEERHLVGTEYKNKGQAAAIHLGLQLTAPYRDTRVKHWSELVQSGAVGALTCWRGGLRSKISQEWLKEAALHLPRVEGGYKAIRTELLRVIDSPPPLVVIGGWTGSGKTKLLEGLSVQNVDLEGLAVHRGSCFGERLDSSGEVARQPSQATFENNIALAFWGRSGRFVIEDESTRIGSLNIPRILKEKMKSSEVVFVQASEDERAGNIFEEYIKQPLLTGMPSFKVEEFFIERLKFLKRHLGGLDYEQIASEIRSAFSHQDEKQHLTWIKKLLIRHYDKSYEFAFNRLERKIIFRGTMTECRDFLNSSIKD